MRPGAGGTHRKLMDWQAPDPRLGPMLGILATSYELEPHFVETDLLPALLGLGAWDDRSWSGRVALERSLAGLEATSILTDLRRYRGRPRSLHVEVRPAVGVGGQLLHAKVLIVVHEYAVRFQLGSANLTEAGYRENREVALPLVARQEAPEVASVVLHALEAMPTRLEAWWTESAGVVHGLAVERLQKWARVVPPDVHVVWGGGSEPLWVQVLSRWPAGEEVERVAVVSPFWSEEGSGGPLTRLTGHLRSRGALASAARVDLYTDAEPISGGGFRPRLPPLGLIDPGKLGVRMTAHAVLPLPTDEPGAGDVLKTRALHAKVVILEGPRTTLAYIGSANFTAPGWGFTGTEGRANVEAGLILVRRGGTLASDLLPPTAGKPVEISAEYTCPVLEKSTAEKPVPTFVRGVWLEPDPANLECLRLAIRVDRERVRGSFEVRSTGEDRIVWLQAGEGCPEETHLALDARGVERLLREQQVSVAWWASTESSDYPLNVELASRAQLPTVPGCSNPGEKLLLAYYQGRISATDLFPPPPGWVEKGDEVAAASVQTSEVDTSRIQSYQVREFVEALQGIRDDLAAASKATAATMRLAVSGPVSPVALARQVRDAARTGARGATAAGFELVEIATCFKEAALADGVPLTWQKLLGDGRRAIEVMLDELAVTAPEELGPKTSFARYAREVLGWRANGGQVK